VLSSYTFAKVSVASARVVGDDNSGDFRKNLRSAFCVTVGHQCLVHDRVPSGLVQVTSMARSSRFLNGRQVF
jgi:hypothetical protein